MFFKGAIEVRNVVEARVISNFYYRFIGEAQQ